jgi:exodeoxyribonuclease VII large subunit
MNESSNSYLSTSPQNEFSVAQLARLLKDTIETKFPSVRVRGEISGLKVHTSGHAYFALKDTDAVLDAVCWRGQYARLQVHPTEGMEVICSGRLTTYPGRSKYQIIVDTIEIAGVGALLKILEDRKKKLAAEGLFAPERKKKLPFLPSVIGIVTSQTGAVIKDIMHRLEDRFPRHVILWPVLVQGDGAAEQIAAAINGFNSMATPPDVLIVARGGGSVEDLWAFNEEVVVRAAANSRIPLISAVGHETDTTLIDFASDLRAPTPTGAAEMVVPVRLDLLHAVRDRHTRLLTSASRFIEDRRQFIETLGRAIPNLNQILEEKVQRLDDRFERLHQSMCTYVDRKNIQLRHLTSGIKIASYLNTQETTLKNHGLLLESYSYTNTLKRGFVMIKDRGGEPLTSAKKIKTNDFVTLTFHDGDKGAKILSDASLGVMKTEQLMLNLDTGGD